MIVQNTTSTAPVNANLGGEGVILPPIGFPLITPKR